MNPLRRGYLLCLATLILLCSGNNAAAAAERPWTVGSQPFGMLTMPELVKPPPAGKKLFVKVTAGYQYDTNVILNAQGAPVPPDVGRKDDSRFVLNLAGTYLPLKGPRGDLALNYAFFQSQHGELDDFNLTQNMAELAGRYRVDDRLTVRFSTLFQHLQLGAKLFDYAFIVGPSVVVSEGQGQSTVVDLRYRATDYENVAIFRNNAIRSGDNYQAAITQNIAISPTILLRAGYGVDADDTRSPLWDGVGHKVNLEGSFIVPHDSLLDIYAEYYRKDYEGVYASIGDNRTDNAWSAVVTATTYFEERYGVSLRALFSRNISNVPTFDMSRLIAGILFDVRF